MILAGKVALVTGARRGLGKAIALRLAQAGADLVINDLAEGEPEGLATVEEIRQLGRRATWIPASVCRSEEVNAMAEQALGTMGKVDVLVNNAGITRDGLLVRMSDEQWSSVLEVNLTGAFLCTRALSKSMMKQRAGSIINIASVVGLIGNVGQVNYAASKAGLIGFTKAAAKELAPRGIRVNAIAPGFIRSAMTDQLSTEAQQRLLSLIPLERFGTPEEVAEAACFLASDASAYITGQVLQVDGGMRM